MQQAILPDKTKVFLNDLTFPSSSEDGLMAHNEDYKNAVFLEKQIELYSVLCAVSYICLNLVLFFFFYLLSSLSLTCPDALFS